MTKVPENGDDVLHKGETLVLRAMRRTSGSLPAREWFDGLDKAGKAKVLARFKILENSLIANRPLNELASKIGNSKRGLIELRVTPKGGSAPHLRMLYKRASNTIWAACGFTKRTNRLDPKDIDLGDRITTEWEETQG